MEEKPAFNSLKAPASSKDSRSIFGPDGSHRTTTLETVKTYLSSILERHREAASQESRNLDEVIARAKAGKTPRGFAAALEAHEGLSLIAEVKRRSPSLGPLVPNLDPAELSRSYLRGGASCCSVLTDEISFGGSAEDLQLVSQSVPLPVLRKDFTVSLFDVADARLMGADAVLLIVAALADGELADFAALAQELLLDVLVEVHDEEELERAMELSPQMVGVNQRDLVTFNVDTSRAQRVARQIPPTVVAVAESGIKTSDDAKALADVGFQAILVGETLVKASSPEAAARELVGFPVRKEEQA
jgi:indole-3-glycerol phosphate synthase